MSIPEVFITAAKRTPFGSYGGKLSHLSATQLGGIASNAALKTLKSPPRIDTVIFGNVIQSSNDAPYLARHIGRIAGCEITVPALTINKLCGSGFQAAINGTHEIKLGEANVALVGGSESMSQAPFALRNSRFGVKGFNGLKLDDTLAKGLVDEYPTPTPMGITGENVAKKYNITREESDNWAFQSQSRYAKALAKGYFEDELCSVKILDRKTKLEVDFRSDEHPRETPLSILSKLKPSFDKEKGVITAASASGINDGAGALILSNKKGLVEFEMKPLARIVAYACVGVDPSIMGIGPIPAIQQALKTANLTLNDIDLVEINEAFAPQFLACAKELKLDLVNKANLDGGAIAIGHPLAASGARILAHLTHRLIKSNLKYAIGAACIGKSTFLQKVAIVDEHLLKVFLKEQKLKKYCYNISFN